MYFQRFQLHLMAFSRELSHRNGLFVFTLVIITYYTLRQPTANLELQGYVWIGGICPKPAGKIIINFFLFHLTPKDPFKIGYTVDFKLVLKRNTSFVQKQTRRG